ncbi:MAG: hypothetical protein AAFX56_08850 [Pseudomonadota bacterium]
MDSGILKSVLLFLPVLAYLVWEIVKLKRDPELRNTPADDRSSSEDTDS